VTRFKKGDEVYARVDSDRIGTFAEFAAVRDGAAALKPANVTFEEAASLPLVALTAWQALVEIGRLGANQRVLIHAGSGDTLVRCFECVRPGGVVVSINSSTPSPAFARDWGLNPVLVFAIRVLSRKAMAAARKHEARYEYLFVRADGEQLSEIALLVECGAIVPVVDKVFPLDEVRDALAYSESGRATGKVVIKVV
jgi:NADPH:quinone reductase-like Zn-dependent oxidoreductase